MREAAALWLVPLAALISWAVARLVIRHAARLKLVQAPNERSSHTVPTPRGGGVGIVLGASIAAATLYLAGERIDGWAAVLALLVGAVGLWDDVRSLSSGLRLAAQIAAVALLLFHTGPLPPFEFAEALTPTGFAGMVVVGLMLVWWVNLFNFMDGIDGIASAQAIFMLSGALALAALGHPERMTTPAAVWSASLAAAVAGFAILNWPPARVFMGDVGSTYLGFAIAAVALASIHDGWLPYGAWLVLAASFVTDATATLLARLARRKRLDQAHRGHAYQRLARRLGSHRAVTLLYLGIDVFWLLPIAWACLRWPQHEAALIALAYLPLAAAVASVIGPKGSIRSRDRHLPAG